ncbi:MAG: hypothetical protein HPY75_15100 [Actinobacteria bacterium]|nr:hypothetical protein [Actinomycetota bacterium]
MRFRGSLLFIALVTVFFFVGGFSAAYASPPENARGVHATSGNGKAATQVFLPEGYTGAGYRNWIALNNVHDTEANTVSVRFYGNAGYIRTLTYVLEPRGRGTVDVNPFLNGGIEFCTRVSGTRSVVAERSTYRGTEGSSSRCCANPGEDSLFAHCLAEGYVDSANGYDCWISIQNCTSSPITVYLRFVDEGGANYPVGNPGRVKKDIPGYSRGTVHVNDYVPNGKAFVTRLWSSNKFCAERVSYGPYFMHSSEGDPLGALDFTGDATPTGGNSRSLTCGISNPYYKVTSYIASGNYDSVGPLVYGFRYYKFDGSIYASNNDTIGTGIDNPPYANPARRSTVSYTTPNNPAPVNGVMELWSLMVDEPYPRHVQWEQTTYRNNWWGYSVSGNHRFATKIYFAEGYTGYDDYIIIHNPSGRKKSYKVWFYWEGPPSGVSQIWVENINPHCSSVVHVKDWVPANTSVSVQIDPNTPYDPYTSAERVTYFN